MMKNRLYLIALAFFLFIGTSTLRSLPTGAPTDGRTGAPGDGFKTCAASGCHSATPTQMNSIITTNIPTEGYTPGATYTITVTVDGSGKKGLCVSPQRPDGTVIGTLTGGLGNQVTGKGYITHTMPKTTIPAVWTFTWQAPAAGTGDFSFYGAFANNRTQVRKAEILIQENKATALADVKGIASFELYPNPMTGDDLHLGFEVMQTGNFQITVLDMTGKVVAQLHNEITRTGSFKENYSLPQLSKGIYFVQIAAGNEIINKKFLKQ